MRKFRLSRAWAKYHSGLCSPFVYSVYPMILIADREGPDQTARMRRLIWVFAVCICPQIRFRLARPIWFLRVPFGLWTVPTSFLMLTANAANLIKKFYGRHHDLVSPYNVSVSTVISDAFANANTHHRVISQENPKWHFSVVSSYIVYTYMGVILTFVMLNKWRCRAHF